MAGSTNTCHCLAHLARVDGRLRCSLSPPAMRASKLEATDRDQTSVSGRSLAATNSRIPDHPKTPLPPDFLRIRIRLETHAANDRPTGRPVVMFWYEQARRRPSVLTPLAVRWSPPPPPGRRRETAGGTQRSTSIVSATNEWHRLASQCNLCNSRASRAAVAAAAGS